MNKFGVSSQEFGAPGPGLVITHFIKRERCHPQKSWPYQLRNADLGLRRPEFSQTDKSWRGVWERFSHIANQNRKGKRSDQKSHE